MIAPLLTLLCSSLAAAAYTPGIPGAAWSRAEVLAVKAKLRMSFSKAWAMPGWANTALGTTDPGDNGGGYSAAKVLRLTFHDCLKYTDGTGGCDGCLNWAGVGTQFKDAPGQKLYADVGATDNNGLRHTVEVLEALYTVPTFLASSSPTLATSLRDSGKSRADLWALAGIVAVEWGVETNNLKCAGAAVGGCHHLQGEPGCNVTLPTIPFRTGRADCVPTDTSRPYIAAKHEAHPNSVGDGAETVKFFQDNFGFSGQETVAIMGAHTFGRLNIGTSLFRYVWTSRGTRFFNNDYYKMIVDDTRWFFDDDACTKVGDAHNNRPARRWVAHYRGDTANNGPVHWISENYVCPNCVANPGHKCCQNVPAGLFCTPDAKNRTEKSPQQLSQPWAYCEAFRFISGIDEMALPCEMGLYFDFKNRGNGFPTGCPGLKDFDGTNWQSWSSIGWVKADPQCALQPLALPASDHSTSWYMREYAANQDRFMRDFVAAFDKMLSNGYTGLAAGPDQATGVECSSQLVTAGWGSWSQCYTPGTLMEDTTYTIVSKLDGRVVTRNATTGAAEMKKKNSADRWQQWRLRLNSGGSQSGQLVSAGDGSVLAVKGVSDWRLGAADGQGYVTILANGGLVWRAKDQKPVAWDRGWSQTDGAGVGLWKQHGAPNQRFQFELVDVST